ncbi:MAG: NAD-dependent epimerase/dehydratase family protein, partial [Acidocella sp.]|nr:NAD-dependent epimerase/dehydratase family protein [Acidocella sp.]
RHTPRAPARTADGAQVGLSQNETEAPVLCTGAAGYIGAAIVNGLAAAGYKVLAGLRRDATVPRGAQAFITGDLSQERLVLPRLRAVVHAAGLGHRRGVTRDVYLRDNVAATVNVARAARNAGASRFILVSTAHVHGRVHNDVVTDTTAANPMDMYAVSKLMAERAAADAFGPGFCALRPVAVIGPGCPGNIGALLNLLRLRLPLPLGGIANRRSFIARDDLAALVVALLRAPDVSGPVLAAHPEAVSTPELIRALAAGIGVRSLLWPCPSPLLAMAAKLLRREALWQSVSGSFVAAPMIAQGLGWRPQAGLYESLRATARYYDPRYYNTAGETLD